MTPLPPRENVGRKRDAPRIRHRARTAVALLCLFLAGSVSMACVLPHVPRWLWQSKNPGLQEMAIPFLMRQIKDGMRPGEVARLFGETNACLDVGYDGRGRLSFNVNSWYNTGIDVGFANDVVRDAHEYD